MRPELIRLNPASGSRPKTMFTATDIAGTWGNSCSMIEMPTLSASRDLRKVTSHRPRLTTTRRQAAIHAERNDRPLSALFYRSNTSSTSLGVRTIDRYRRSRDWRAASSVIGSHLMPKSIQLPCPTLTLVPHNPRGNVVAETPQSVCGLPLRPPGFHRNSQPISRQVSTFFSFNRSVQTMVSFP